MNDAQVDAYVRAALTLQGYRLDEHEIQRVIVQFARIASIADSYLTAPMPFQAEAAPVFTP